MRRLFVMIIAVMVAGCNLNTVSPTPAPTADIPRVEFLYPESSPDNPARVVEGTDLTIDVVARDETAGIYRVELYLNGQLLNESPPQLEPLPVFRVEMNWFANGIGRHVLSAIAYRQDGTQSNMTTLMVEVIAP